MWFHQGLVDLQIGRTSTQALDVDPPLLRVETEGLQRPSLTQELNGVNVLIPAIVSGAWVALGVLIGHGRPQGVEDGAGREVFRRNEDNRFTLPFDLVVLFGQTPSN